MTCHIKLACHTNRFLLNILSFPITKNNTPENTQTDIPEPEVQKTIESSQPNSQVQTPKNGGSVINTSLNSSKDNIQVKPERFTSTISRSQA